MSKQLAFMPDAWDEYIAWQKQDKKTLKRINELIKDINREPFTGIGKPEPLKGDKHGYWSRRIFVYQCYSQLGKCTSKPWFRQPQNGASPRLDYE